MKLLGNNWLVFFLFIHSFFSWMSNIPLFSSFWLWYFYCVCECVYEPKIFLWRLVQFRIINNIMLMIWHDIHDPILFDYFKYNKCNWCHDLYKLSWFFCSFWVVFCFNKEIQVNGDRKWWLCGDCVHEMTVLIYLI